jgi:hypothetical protein
MKQYAMPILITAIGFVVGSIILRYTARYLPAV